MAKPLIVFDLDGTLIDSQRDLAESANELLANHDRGPLPTGEIGAMVGDGARLLIARALRRAGLEIDLGAALAEFFEIYGRRLLNHTRPYPGVGDLLDGLAPRAALALLTNKPERFIPPILDAFGMTGHFMAVIGGDSVYPRKPDPASLRHLMSLARAEPATSLMVGDSMVDVETARRARARMCVALYGFGQSRGDLTLAGDELLAESPAHLRPVLEAFLSDSCPTI